MITAVYLFLFGVFMFGAFYLGYQAGRGKEKLLETKPLPEPVDIEVDYIDEEL